MILLMIPFLYIIIVWYISFRRTMELVRIGGYEVEMNPVTRFMIRKMGSKCAFFSGSMIFAYWMVQIDLMYYVPKLATILMYIYMGAVTFCYFNDTSALRNTIRDLVEESYISILVEKEYRRITR